MSADAIERSIDQIEFPLAVGQSSSYRCSNFVGPLSFPLAVKQPDNKHLWSNFLMIFVSTATGRFAFPIAWVRISVLLASGLTASGKTQVKGRSDRQAMRSLSGPHFGLPCWQAAWQQARSDASQKGSPSNSLCYLKKDLSRKVPNRKAKRVAQQQGKMLLYNLVRIDQPRTQTGHQEIASLQSVKKKES